MAAISNSSYLCVQDTPSLVNLYSKGGAHASHVPFYRAGRHIRALGDNARARASGASFLLYLPGTDKSNTLAPLCQRESIPKPLLLAESRVKTKGLILEAWVNFCPLHCCPRHSGRRFRVGLATTDEGWPWRRGHALGKHARGEEARA